MTGAGGLPTLRQLVLVLAIAMPACVDSVSEPDPSTHLDGGSGDGGSVKVACDGALCNTSNGSQCNAGGDPTWIAGVALGLTALVRRRRQEVRR
jgi:uncharacterized protein (TIGR03382 family)